jgi:hypothetical protein
MPGDLREKIKLWEVLNKILKQNGFIDADQINSDIANLKTKLNTLLAEVLGIEHDIDGVHNYDDAPLKNKIVELQGNLVDFVNDINNDINNLSARLNGLNVTSSRLSLTNDSSIEANVVAGDIKLTQLKMTTNFVSMYASTEDYNGNIIPKAQLILGGTTTNDGIDIESINPVSLTCTGGPGAMHSIIVGQEQVALTDVNGLRIRYDDNGIIITDWGNFKTARIPWE